MLIFDNEKMEINEIYSVKMYAKSDADPKIYNYGTAFYCSELVFFFKGENNTMIDDVKLKDCPNSLRFIPKGTLKGKYIVESVCVPSVCVDVYFDITGGPKGVSYSYDNKQLNDKFLKLYIIWSKREVGYYAKAMSVLYEIIAEIQHEQYKYLDKKQRNYMQKAYNYILDNYRMCEFDYKELCNSTGLKYAYFSQLFKETYGMSPVKFVTKMKIDYAKELLVTNRYSIVKIAEMSGFNDVSYFSKSFKKQTGFSPTKYMGEIENIQYNKP